MILKYENKDHPITVENINLSCHSFFFFFFHTLKILICDAKNPIVN
jgi:hypothetical protein